MISGVTIGIILFLAGLAFGGVAYVSGKAASSENDAESEKGRREFFVFGSVGVFLGMMGLLFIFT